MDQNYYVVRLELFILRLKGTNKNQISPLFCVTAIDGRDTNMNQMTRDQSFGILSERWLVVKFLMSIAMMKCCPNISTVLFEIFYLQT